MFARAKESSAEICRGEVDFRFRASRSKIAKVRNFTAFSVNSSYSH